MHQHLRGEQRREHHDGKEINVRKIDAMLDTVCSPLMLQAHQASVKVAMVVGHLPKISCRAFPYIELAFPYIELAFADSAYSGRSRRLAHRYRHPECSRVIPSTL